MKAFVTGATGFLGNHLARKLIQRGYEVYALTRSEQGAAELSSLGATIVRGSILDKESMRQGMAGSDVVFHTAEYSKLGADDWMQAEAVNVAGTRNVLSLAQELKVPKIVYTSNVVVFGDTQGQLVDENYYQAGPFVTEYDRTKWLAHYKVAVPLIEAAAPIIIVMPGSVYGPGADTYLGDLMQRFYEGKLPVMLAPELTLTYAHVEDVAEGHILAAEKGKIGESYILAGPAVPLNEVIDFWSQLTGKPGPKLRVPNTLVQPIMPVADALSLLPISPPINRETIALLNVTYMARSDKARAQLGWRTRSLQEGMSETFRWIAATTPKPAPGPDRRQQVAAVALLAAAVLFVFWLLGQRRK